ncbi:hypothetical protein RhiTH_005413 [Rhizoctonia solani]|uniref:Uncharacterized protein n=1 Tax=Rhizoctonia solani TaxID=456999 RepID=A0A8H7ID47_9AGAM|nr:hypothetical protein RHS04_06853 [Rhizoctonia solani]KAF8755486.1 hypothetical protein RHS01_05150 [Rhizoctonia solani]
MSLTSVSAALDWLRTPPFEIWGVSFPLMDLIGAFRLAIVLRQIKKLKGGGTSNVDTQVSPWITALILFGGEAIMCSQLSLTPGFLTYPNITLLFMGVQVLVNEVIPEPPAFRFSVELPLAVFDAFGRALLLCDFAPSLIAKHPDPVVANSPLALLITSGVLTNGGFFFVNLLNMLDPRGWRVDRTPPEALPWGWTAVDLWTAPVITAFWASLTHWRVSTHPETAHVRAIHPHLNPLPAPLSFLVQSSQNQPFWANIHSRYLGSGAPKRSDEKPVALEAWTHTDARSLCIVILVTLFVLRTWWNMGPLPSFKTKIKKSQPSSPTSLSEKPSSAVTSAELIERPVTPTSIRKRRNKQSRGKSVTQVE